MPTLQHINTLASVATRFNDSESVSRTYNQSKFTPKGFSWVASLWAQCHREAV